MNLPGLDEPVGLRARAANDPDRVRAGIVSGHLIVTPVWKAWGPALTAEGLNRATLSAVLRGYGYELWLWAAGERTWAQFVEGLAGRVSRRVGTSADGRPARRTARARKRPRAAAGKKPAGRTTKVAKSRKATTAPAARRAGKATKARKAKATKARPVNTARKAKVTKATKVRAATKARQAQAKKVTQAGKTARPTKRARSAKTRRR